MAVIKVKAPHDKSPSIAERIINYNKKRFGENFKPKDLYYSASLRAVSTVRCSTTYIFADHSTITLTDDMRGFTHTEGL